MGQVYRARDARLNRDVAIKVSGEQFSERFESEAKAIAALNHPNICQIYDVGPDFLVMEYIDGRPIVDCEQPQALPPDEALQLARQIAAALETAHGKGIIHRDLKPANILATFAAWLRSLFRKDWVVYAKRPFGGPEYVLHYLGRYTHRVAISNHRLISFTERKVTFRWRDSAHNNEQKLLTLALEEFLRRFLLHLLPKGFVRIRNFGFLANRRRAALLPLCFQLLGTVQKPPTDQDVSSTNDSHDLWRCPKCGGPMVVIERLTAAEIQLRSPPLLTAA